MEEREIRRVAVIGAGLMGHGIAQEYALGGYDVALHDVSDERLREAGTRIRANLALFVEQGLATAEQAATVPERIRASTSLAEVARDADLVVEAVYENLELKRGIFAELDRCCPPHTILASNTSTFMPSKLATATNRADRVLVTHYFNPPHLLPLVEVVRGAATADQTIDTVVRLLQGLGKQVALVRQEVPGFIGNRIQAAIFREIFSIVERGIATPQDVDTVVKYGFGRRLAVAGPFELQELIGYDLVQAVAEELYPAIESRTDVPEILTEKVRRGELGIKSGQGFYTWTPESAEALRQRVARALIEIERWAQA